MEYKCDKGRARENKTGWKAILFLFSIYTQIYTIYMTTLESINTKGDDVYAHTYV